jgi:hypothetical protein
LAWVGYAITLFLSERKTKDTAAFQRSRRVKLLMEKSTAMAGYILSQMIQDQDDERYGLVMGGYGHYELQVDPVKAKVVERFIDQPVNWCSTEHNIDSYFFLRDLGRLKG